MPYDNAIAVDPCLACGGSGVSIAWARRYPLARCGSCDLAFAASWRSQIGGSAFHAGNESYYERMEADAEARRPSALNLRRLHALFERLERLVPERSLLDVGCGRGDAVRVASQRGWSARGIDLASGAIRICVTDNLDCQQLDFFAPELDASRFALIVMSEFIEHVPEPLRFLRRAHDLLLPKGLLYLTTPNFDSLGRRVLGDVWAPLHEGHIAFFNVRTLRAYARSAGFTVENLATVNLSASALLSLAQRLRRRSAVLPSSASQQSHTAALRSAVYESPWLRRMKTIADPLIYRSGMGETLIGHLRKHAPPT